eukprot:753233-Hanusia_phi.AAC.3
MAEDGTPKARSLGMPWDIPVNSPEDVEGIRAGPAAGRPFMLLTSLSSESSSARGARYCRGCGEARDVDRRD